MRKKAVVYTPSSLTKNISIPSVREPVLEREKVPFIISDRFSSSDGFLHNVVLYTVPTGKVLFVEKVSIIGVSNDALAATNAGYISVTALGYFIGSIELAATGTTVLENTYPTPLKLIEGKLINILYFQPSTTVGVYLVGVVIVSGYLLDNF